MERVTRLPKPRAIFPEPASLFSSSWPLLPFIWGRDLRSNDHTFLNPPHCGFLSWSVSWFSFTHTPFLFFHSRLCLGLCLQEGKCGGAGLQRTQAFHFPFNPLLLEPHPSSHLGQCITYTHILFPLQGLSSQTGWEGKGLGLLFPTSFHLPAPHGLYAKHGSGDKPATHHFPVSQPRSGTRKMTPVLCF